MKALLRVHDSDRKKQRKIMIILWVAAALMIVCSVLVFLGSIKAGANETESTYKKVKEETSTEVYTEYYNIFYDIAERKNHVSNEVTINIENTQELAELEVLKVSDVEFIVENEDDNKENITMWLEVPGEGVFTVDLAGSEFLTDEERKYVVARIPKPELTEFRIDKENIRLLKWDNDVFDDSIEKGEALAQKNMEKAQELIKQEFAFNQSYYNSAKDMAEILIVSLIKGWNPDIPDLEVVVEFIE